MVATAAANVSAGRVTRTLSRSVSGRAVLATGRWTKRILYGTAFAVVGGSAVVYNSDEGLYRTLRVVRSIAPMFVARQDSAEPFSRLKVQRCTAMDSILIPANCSANP